jgi:hypothetical protein
MSRKSLLVSMSITTAGRGHNCRYNKKHRIEKDDRRLTIKVGRDERNYCLACAKVFMADSLARLQAMSAEVDALTGRPQALHSALPVRI